MKRALVLAMAGILGGCTTMIDRTPINQPPHPLTRRPAGSVEVFSAARPDRPFVDVALLEANPGADNETTVLAKLRADAGAMGCDAIIFNGADNRDRANVARGYSATCIVYR